MPTNVTAEYKKNEAEYRSAREPKEKLRCLREMLRTIPKHKGTEHLQADIKTRIKTLTEELESPKKGGRKAGPVQAVRPEGAAQLSLVGPPNAGKSSLLAKLTGAKAEIGPYPYSTKAPLPGMLPYEDIHFQLVDLPPISRDFMEPWFVNALQTSDGVLLVVDMSDLECVDHVPAILERLHEKKVSLVETWPGKDRKPIEEEADEGAEPDPFRLFLPTLLVANKYDLDPDPDEVKVLEELLNVRFPTLSVSAETGQGLDQFGSFLFENLDVIRVYTKTPSKPKQTDRPYTLRGNATVLDLARQVHKEIAEKLKFAKIWGSGQFEGQQVGHDHVLADKDIVELHM